MTIDVLEIPYLLSCLCKLQGRRGALHLILIPSWFPLVNEAIMSALLMAWLRLGLILAQIIKTESRTRMSWVTESLRQ